ncbi:MAG: hypothetical protein JSS28_06305 [Proteobacteria bacterium]|nr:hypothetical protein [Pseudomonadota bacterium]
MNTPASLHELAATGAISAEIEIDLDGARSIALRFMGNAPDAVVAQANGAYLRSIADSLAHAGQIVALDCLEQDADDPQSLRTKETALNLFTAVRLLGGLAAGLQRFERALTATRESNDTVSP